MRPYLVLAIFLAMASTAAAQDEATMKLRNGDEVTGVITDVTADSLFFVQPHALHYAEREQGYPVFGYSRREVLTVEFGGGPGIVMTTLVGLAIGTAVGTVAALSMREEDHWLSDAFIDWFRSITLISGAVLGTAIGAISGLVMKHSRQVYDVSIEEHYRELRMRFGTDTQPLSDSPPFIGTTDR